LALFKLASMASCISRSSLAVLTHTFNVSEQALIE
jgi:hypothetical protein